jgi:putative ABC transport system substrate-binding protein
VVVFMPETKQTREVWTGLSDELRDDFSLVAVKVQGSNAAAIIARAMREHRPSGTVLMNNPTVLAYREYQRARGTGPFPPAIIVMTSFLDGRPDQVAGAMGISYEIPLITVVTNLRRLIATPIERVGVVRREPLAGFVARQAALGKREQIQVVEASVSADPNPSELKRALRNLKQDCDALWILNDDRLLSQSQIAHGWLPGLNERPWVPAIVGAASLVSPTQSFGTFAMLPDHTALGTQAANLVFDIAENGWRLLPDGEVELPLSTTTAMDLVQVEERFALRTDALAQVDRILR